MTNKEIANALQEARKEKKWLYRELATRAGVMPDTAREACHGIRKPTLDRLQALCDALGLEIVIRKKGSNKGIIV